MKKIFLSLILLAGISVQAQKQSIFGFSSPDIPFQWKAIQEFSPSNTNTIKTIYDGKQALQVFDGHTRKSASANADAGLVAAAGYNETTKQLFYIPMHAAELRWAQWNGHQAPTIYSIKSNILSLLDFNKTEQQITRMTIDRKGVGYALTNDAMHLIEFTTGERPILRDLGPLIDAGSNGQNSIHNACSSFGGDMVAGDDGYIYLITQRSNIYVFSPQTRIAKHLGSINGLPQLFTPNGAAAMANGELLLSCSNGDQNCYIVNPENWEARSLSTENPKDFNMSDLASGYLLSRKPKPASFFQDNHTSLHVFPNPMSRSRLQISLENAVSGNYQVQLLDMTGKVINQQIINLSQGSQSVYLNYPAETAKGTYIIKVTNPSDKTIHSSKLMIQ
jgi:hypothetical protein